MNIDDMRALVAVVEEGSLAGAALRLGLTQPAVTRRIQHLEESLEANLLDREQKPARPTAAGQRAYKACLQVLHATDALRGAVGAGHRPSAIRLGISLGLADAVLQPLFTALKRHDRDLTIDLVTGRSPSLREQLAAGKLDAAVIFTVMQGRPDPRDNPVALGVEPVDVVAAAGAPLADHVALQALGGQSWIINPDGCMFRTQLENRLNAAGQPMLVSASIWGTPQQLALIADGAGLGLVPRRACQQPEWANRVRIVTVDGFRPQLAPWLIHAPAEGWLAEALTVIEATLAAVFGQEGAPD